MTTTCQKYRYNKIDIQGLYRGYRSFVEYNDYAQFLQYLAPLFNSIFKKYIGDRITESEFDDLFQDVSLRVYYYLNKNRDIAKPGMLYTAIVKIVNHGIIDNFRIYRPLLYRDSTDSAEVCPSDYGSPKSIYMKLHFKDTVKLIVQEFIHRLRFSGDYRRICIYIFNQILSKESIDEEFLRYRYKVDPQFFKEYTMILIRSIIHDFSMRDHYAFQDIV